jgi:hypothetical protein
MPIEEIRTYPIERLREFAARVFEHFGAPADDAESVRRRPRGVSSFA